MGFVSTKYEADSGDIHPIRIGDENVAFAGAAPSGEIDNDIRVKVTKTNREFGLRPRYVVLARTVGTTPNDFKRYKRVPMLTQQAWEDAEVPIEIGGDNWTEIVSKEPEDF